MARFAKGVPARVEPGWTAKRRADGTEDDTEDDAE